MKYDINKPLTPAGYPSKNGQNVSVFCTFRPQKRCISHSKFRGSSSKIKFSAWFLQL